MLDRRHLAVVLEPSAPSRDPRRRILDALVRTVALRGYDRTTVEQVLALAEVPAPVFDEHFEDMQDCLLAALDELLGRVERTISARIEKSTSWSERVRLGLRALLETLADHPDGARVMFVECLSAGEPAHARLCSAMASFVPILEQGRDSSRSDHARGRAEAAGSGTGHLPPQTSEAVVGGIASILHRRVLEHHTSELPALLGELLYFALMPYLGHERALAAAGFASGPTTDSALSA
jgi:AcrR family transcriptional regulator